MDKIKEIDELINDIGKLNKIAYAVIKGGSIIEGFADSTKIAYALYEAGYRKMRESVDDTQLARGLETMPNPTSEKAEE